MAKRREGAVQVRDRVKELRRVRASELRPSPRNWRTHPPGQQDALRGVLAEVGYADALLAREVPGGLELIDGHLRAETTPDALVPVLVLDVTAEEAALLLATLDPLAATAGADAARLQSLLAEVSTGSPALEAMLADLAERSGVGSPGWPTPGGGGDDFDATPAGQGPTRTQPGELWLIGGKHRLLVGDCTVRENVERLMGGGKAGVVVTDPPYAVDYVKKARDMNARGYGHSRGTLAAAIRGDGLDEDAAAELWRASLNVAREVAAVADAAWYVWHAPGRAMLTLYNLLASLGFLHHQTIIWVKNNFVIGRSDYQWQHEPCWYGWFKGDRPKYVGEKNQTTVWIESRDTNAPLHPTQKPVECMARPIRNHGAPGDLVYDPFLGSGTTLIAAHRLGRVCCGCEVEPRYADVVLGRAEAEGLTVQKAG